MFAVVMSVKPKALCKKGFDIGNERIASFWESTGEQRSGEPLLEFKELKTGVLQKPAKKLVILGLCYPGGNCKPARPSSFF